MPAMAFVLEVVVVVVEVEVEAEEAGVDAVHKGVEAAAVHLLLPPMLLLMRKRLTMNSSSRSAQSPADGFIFSVPLLKSWKLLTPPGYGFGLRVALTGLFG